MQTINLDEMLWTCKDANIMSCSPREHDGMCVIIDALYCPQQKAVITNSRCPLTCCD